MLNSRHTPDRTILVRTFGVSFPNGRELKMPLVRDWHQLIYATQGVMTVRSANAAWVVPPHRALWVPAGVDVRLHWSGPVALRSLYLAKGRRLGNMPRQCTVWNVTPLLRELILRAVEHGALNGAMASQRRLAEVILDELARLSEAPLQLPLPVDARALRFAELWQSSNASVKTLMRRAGASRRTLERLFHAETAMSLGQWMRRERLLRALRLLAEGETVQATAAKLGYSSPSAFIAMFRRQLGETPGGYFE
jgi:AraC-like DNA-binding protein